MAVVKQQEIFQEGFRDFLSWARSPKNLSYDKIYEKINEIFTKGEYSKVSNDILQMACGHRADLIDQRRSKILACVKDPLVKTMLRKIPPTCHNLFAAEQFSSALEKVGGVRKVFWAKSNKQAAQANVTKLQPAQGCSRHYNSPAQGDLHSHCGSRPQICC